MDLHVFVAMDLQQELHEISAMEKRLDEQQRAFKEWFTAAQVPGFNSGGTALLTDGTVGYYARRADDCFASAVATCLQVPIEEVPDPSIDALLDRGESPDEINRVASAEWARWFASRELAMTIHSKVPVKSDRWIGIVPLEGEFQSHCLVMSGREVLFDPTDPKQYERPVCIWDAEDVKSGLSFTRKESN